MEFATLSLHWGHTCTQCCGGGLIFGSFGDPLGPFQPTASLECWLFILFVSRAMALQGWWNLVHLLDVLDLNRKRKDYCLNICKKSIGSFSDWLRSLGLGWGWYWITGCKIQVHQRRVLLFKMNPISLPKFDAFLYKCNFLTLPLEGCKAKITLFGSQSRQHYSLTRQANLQLWVWYPSWFLP